MKDEWRAAMLVLIDKSGDPGFKLDRGSSDVFVLAPELIRWIAEAKEDTAS